MNNMKQTSCRIKQIRKYVRCVFIKIVKIRLNCLVSVQSDWVFFCHCLCFENFYISLLYFVLRVTLIKAFKTPWCKILSYFLHYILKR